MFPTVSLHSNLFPCKCLYIFNVKINTKWQNLEGILFRTSIQKTQTYPDTHTVYTIHTQTAIPGFAFIPQQSKAESVGHSGNLIVPRIRQWPPQDEA